MSKKCVDCGENIGEKRVANSPSVKFCIECQLENEKSGKYRLHKMEIFQTLSGWQHESTNTVIIRGNE